MASILFAISVFLLTSLMIFVMASALTPDCDAQIITMDCHPGGLWD